MTLPASVHAAQDCTVAGYGLDLSRSDLTQ